MGMLYSDELLSSGDVATRLNVSERAVQAWVASGLLPARKIGGVNIIFGQDLDRFQKPKLGAPKKAKKEAA